MKPNFKINTLVEFSAGVCKKSVTVFSIFLFAVYTTIYSSLVYLQFPLYRIIFLSCVFVGIFLFLEYIFSSRRIKILPLELNWKNVIPSLGICLFLVLCADSFNRTDFADYFRTFPVLEADFRLGYTQDTTFHISLIQSILNFGYPSITQNGPHLLVYHVLSHYVDAFVLLITGLDPFDSYGLLKEFKIFLFLAVVLYFISEATKKCSLPFYLFSVLLFIPIVIATWHSIGSHSLWFTTVLLIVSATHAFEIIFNKTNNSTKDYWYIFTIIVLISLGKISTGFMLACFLGMLLLINNPKNYRTYLVGIGLIIFFYYYQMLMGNGNSLGIIWENITWRNLLEYVFHADEYIKPALSATSLSLLLLLMVRKRNLLIHVVSSLVSLFFAFFILLGTGSADMVYTGSTDMVYFEIGLSTILCLFTFKLFADNYNAILPTRNANPTSPSINRVGGRIAVLAILVLLILFALPFSPTDSGTRKRFLGGITQNPFDRINNGSINGAPISEHKLSLISGRQYYSEYYLPMARRFYIDKFNYSLETILSSNGLMKKEVALYIPYEEYEVIKYRLPGTSDWSSGLLIYAITGIQLAYGVDKLIKNFGYSSYSQSDVRVKAALFEPQKVCVKLPIKAIIITDSFSDPHLRLVYCSPT